MTMHRFHPIFDTAAATEWELPEPDQGEFILYNNCDRCAEHAEHPLLSLDDNNLRDMWDQMVIAERKTGFYRTENEAKAGRQLYGIACFMERMLGINPWQSLGDIHYDITILR